MFKATITDNGFSATLTKAENLGSHDYRTAFRRIGRDWLKQIDQGFELEQDPYGNPWQPLSAGTVAAKAKKGVSDPAAILIESGLFRQSFFAEVSRRGLVLTTDRVFEGGVTPEVHQFGGVVDGSPIPPRPFLPLEEIPEFWQYLAMTHLGDDMDRYFAA